MRRPHVITVRLDREKYTSLLESARSSGMSVSTIIRRKVREKYGLPETPEIRRYTAETRAGRSVPILNVRFEKAAFDHLVSRSAAEDRSVASLVRLALRDGVGGGG